MKLRATITLDWEVKGADGVKDLDPERIAQAMERSLNEYSDGRYHLAFETLAALLQHEPRNAIYQALVGVMFRRYGNRMYPCGPRSRSSVAGYIAGRRMEGIQVHWTSIDECAKVAVVPEEDEST